jgi:hypothetical protein
MDEDDRVDAMGALTYAARMLEEHRAP